MRRLEDEVLRCTKESECALDEERNARVTAEDRVGVLEARKAELKQRVAELEEQVEKQAAQSRCAPCPITRRIRLRCAHVIRLTCNTVNERTCKLI